MIGSSREEVSLFVGGAGFMMKGEVVFHQFSDPPGLLTIYFLGFSEILEILMICPDFEVLVCAHKVMPPFLQRKHDSKEFLVIDLIVMFCN